MKREPIHRNASKLSNPTKNCSRNSLGRQLEVNDLINECIALEPAQRNLLDELNPNPGSLLRGVRRDRYARCAVHAYGD
jgi:hypothetical protein